MSNNIDFYERVKGEVLTINSTKVVQLRKKYNKRLPEGNFLDDVEDDGEDWGCEPMWYGEGSGWSFNLLKELLTHMEGTADLVYIFESGEAVGLRVKNGVVTEHKVRMYLEN